MVEKLWIWVLCGVIRVVPRGFVLEAFTLRHKRIGNAEVLRGKIILPRIFGKNGCKNAEIYCKCVHVPVGFRMKVPYKKAQASRVIVRLPSQSAMFYK